MHDVKTLNLHCCELFVLSKHFFTNRNTKPKNASTTEIPSPWWPQSFSPPTRHPSRCVCFTAELKGTWFLLGKKNRGKKKQLFIVVFFWLQKKTNTQKRQLKLMIVKYIRTCFTKTQAVHRSSSWFPWWNVQMSKFPPDFGGIAHLLPEQFALSDLRTQNQPYGGNKPGYEEMRLLVNMGCPMWTARISVKSTPLFWTSL